MIGLSESLREGRISLTQRLRKMDDTKRILNAFQQSVFERRELRSDSISLEELDVAESHTSRILDIAAKRIAKNSKAPLLKKLAVVPSRL
jgi:hypothetical protein